MADAAQYAAAIVLIDGVFQEELAPSPKEVRNACRRCTVVGAASLGALRAVECVPYGARPRGTIARWYATSAIDGDDEVAVIIEPEHERALSVPLVNVRYLLYRARKRGLLDAAESGQILEDARAIFYADRVWDDIFEAAPPLRREALRSLAGEGADLKRMDARFALRSVLRSIQESEDTTSLS